MGSQQINTQLLGMVDYGVFMFIIGFTTLDGKKTSGLIFTGALLTAGRVVGRKGRMMVMVMTCCHYCDSSDNDSNDMQRPDDNII